MNSPLMTASGTSGHSDEIMTLNDSEKILATLGAFVTKGVTLEPKKGNPEYRIVETRYGLLNSIGLQNDGVELFLSEKLSKLEHIKEQFKIPIIVNISADTIEDFGILANKLSEKDINGVIKGIEINVSCPNIKQGGMEFGTNPKLVEKIVNIVKKNVDTNRITIITKLSPNVTDITSSAKAAIDGGTNALSMINTIRGMAIDISTRKPYLGNVYGGLSGPAIKPIGIYMVYKCFNEISACKEGDIPIIGIGGISNCHDAIEYFIAGATAVGIGTAWLTNPTIFIEIFEGIDKYLKKNNIDSISKLVGSIVLRND